MAHLVAGQLAKSRIGLLDMLKLGWRVEFVHDDLRRQPGGLSLFKWCTWTERIHTIANLPIEVNLLNTAQEPIYQKLSNKPLHLRELGFSNRKIAEHPSIDEKTVAKAILWLSNIENWNSN